MDGDENLRRTVEEVFADFKGRRTAFIKALTTDVREFFRQCDPEMDNLCLYGHPSGQWEVKLPDEEVPSELPEPTLGINFSRDGGEENHWLDLVAVHSDSWLLSIAFFYGARFLFDKVDRKRLFDMINDLPTVFEVFQQSKDRSSVTNVRSTKSKSSSNVVKNPKIKANDEDEGMDDEGEGTDDEDDDEDEGTDEEYVDEQDDSFCGACGEKYVLDEFWIYCDFCGTWFHGKCVKITPEKAEQIEKYKCPSCMNKRARPDNNLYIF